MQPNTIPRITTTTTRGIGLPTMWTSAETWISIMARHPRCDRDGVAYPGARHRRGAHQCDSRPKRCRTPVPHDNRIGSPRVKNTANVAGTTGANNARTGTPHRQPQAGDEQRRRHDADPPHGDEAARRRPVEGREPQHHRLARERAERGHARQTARA